METLFPGRIDLGLGRAPGSDQRTVRALRRDPAAADAFPQDVLELQGYLTGQTRVTGVNATPGHGTDVPLYVLGSSMFGAQLAALLGLPYAFASHFAPDALEAAVATYRKEFQPSAQLAEPYVVAGVNVVASDSTEHAQQQAHEAKRYRAGRILAQGRGLTTEQIDALLDSPAGAQVNNMTKYSAVGTGAEVDEYLDGFAERAQADELMVVSSATDRTAWLRSLEILAEVRGLTS